MSFLEKQYNDKIEQLETQLAKTPENHWSRKGLIDNIEDYKRKLLILEKTDIDKVSADMKAILSHTHAIEDKYKCRSVKVMMWLSEFTKKHISIVLGEKIADYTMHKIHAPVCSIVAGKKQDLPPMPQYATDGEIARDKEKRANLEQFRKWREASARMNEEWIKDQTDRSLARRIKNFFITTKKVLQEK